MPDPRFSPYRPVREPASTTHPHAHSADLSPPFPSPLNALPHLRLGTAWTGRTPPAGYATRKLDAIDGLSNLSMPELPSANPKPQPALGSPAPYGFAKRPNLHSTSSTFDVGSTFSFNTNPDSCPEKLSNTRPITVLSPSSIFPTTLPEQASLLQGSATGPLSSRLSSPMMTTNQPTGALPLGGFLNHTSALAPDESQTDEQATTREPIVGRTKRSPRPSPGLIAQKLREYNKGDAGPGFSSPT